MGVCDVAHVSEIEKVIVVTELEAGFVCCVGGEGAGDYLRVAFAEDGGGADGAG
jgi:energy-converting hydrogenase Eha subunit C